MWEVRAADGQLDALVSWVLDSAPDSATVYRSADARVVVIDATGAAMPEVPPELVARPPHSWDFDEVRR
ncbi:MAG: hypothetical protein QOG53_1013 [Frankiales bacterium]|jgi:hypothetical protein|nr:hypothetical protein [Frankiales bacterium]